MERRKEITQRLCASAVKKNKMSKHLYTKQPLLMPGQKLAAEQKSGTLPT